MSDRIVHIVDDEPGVRKATRILLELAGYTTRQYESGPQFLEAMKANPGGCVLLDIRMPDMDGLEVQEKMRERGINMPLIVLTGHGDIVTAVRAIRAGALEFLEKPYAESALVAAIENAFQTMAQHDQATAEAAQANAQIAKLSRRERMVLVGLMDGKANKVIAFDLSISPRTVEMYRARMMDKLGARSLSDALRLGIEARRVGRI